MTVLHARSTPRRRKDVEAVRLLRDESHDRPQLNPDIEESLRRWTARATTDWEYVEGVIAGIQKTCQLDPSSSIEETEDDIVNEFLLVERRGPDYHFAITAAILLRDLGFRTHVVSGFYARPENYDRASGGTAVYADDVHFWVEVQARDLSWVTVEPSPGYEVQYARVTLWERLGQWSCQVLATLWSRRFTLLLCASCAVVLARLHRRIYVWALVCCWLLPLPRTDRAVVRAALSVLDAYAHLQGRQRSPNLTVEDWLQNLHRNCETAIPQWVEFRRLVQWSLYAGTEFAAASDDPRRVCCDILNHYRSVGYGTTPNEEQSNDEGSRENL